MTGSSRLSRADAIGIVGAVVRRPKLWLTALRQVRRLAPRRWWRRSPFLPVPDPAYLRFRTVTFLGDSGGVLGPDDVVTYLEWCRAWPAAVRRSR